MSQQGPIQDTTTTRTFYIARWRHRDAKLPFAYVYVARTDAAYRNRQTHYEVDSIDQAYQFERLHQAKQSARSSALRPNRPHWVLGVNGNSVRQTIPVVWEFIKVEETKVVTYKLDIEATTGSMLEQLAAVNLEV